MAHVNINISKIKYNAKVLQTVFQSKNMQFTPVIKCIAGDRTIVESLKALGINHVAESRLDNIISIASGFNIYVIAYACQKRDFRYDRKS